MLTLIIIGIIYYLFCIGFLEETLENTQFKWFWIILFGYIITPVIFGIYIGSIISKKI